jgi:hypothetical protein
MNEQTINEAMNISDKRVNEIDKYITKIFMETINKRKPLDIGKTMLDISYMDIPEKEKLLMVYIFSRNIERLKNAAKKLLDKMFEEMSLKDIINGIESEHISLEDFQEFMKKRNRK